MSHLALIIRRRGFLVFNLLLLGPPGANSATLGKEISLRANERFPDNPRRLWSSIKKGGRFGLEAPVDEPPTSDATSGHSNLTGSRMRNVQQWTNTSSSWAKDGGLIPPTQPHWSSPRDEIDTDAECSDELDGEELEIITTIQKRRIQSTSLSPFPVSTTIHEVIRSPQPPQPPIRSPTRPSPLASTSTKIQSPMASVSRSSMSPELESIFDKP
ncbi:hypothetical protein O181_090051 [Austropuccinia psidii MF-1]|uniref:Uncharacterized protein n=1 Tax=Austropuccinia psidii MF-1 TaxID=1389203 RepID=A0A9Q3IUT7_9BASI|nr:hypothetical protein [Austropuccinia psidii MF-1]